MRTPFRSAITLMWILCVTCSGIAQSMALSQSTIYSVPSRGGLSVKTPNTSSEVGALYGRVRPYAGFLSPAGLEIIGLRQNGALISEAGVAASTPTRSIRFFSELAGSTKTGIALVNPNAEPAMISFYFADANGIFGLGATTLAGGAKTAAYLDQAPFNGQPGMAAFTLTSSLPIAAMALRVRINERGEALLASLPITDLDLPPASGLVMAPQFVDGGGWRTQLVLTNPTDTSISGVFRFHGPGGEVPIVTTDGIAGNNFAYQIPPKASRRFQTGDGAFLSTGSISVIPSGNSASPAGFTMIAYKPSLVTTTEAIAPLVVPSMAFRMYAEEESATVLTQTGIAIVNASTSFTTVVLELTTLDGVPAASSGSITIPPTGHFSTFLTQVPGFSTFRSFQGILRVSAQSPIAVTGLRTRINERGDFLVTTTAPSDEGAPSQSGPVIFPQVVDSGGYSSQIVLYGGRPDLSSVGAVDLLSASGQGITLAVSQNAPYMLEGIDFSPYVDGQNPNFGVAVSESQLRARLSLLQSDARWARTYSSSRGMERFAEVARQMGFKTAVGAWLGTDSASNEVEINSLIAAGQAGNVDIAIVGSEALLRRDLTEAQLANYIARVKTALPLVPVGTADSYDALMRSPSVIEVSDLVLMNYYGYWGGLPVELGVAALHEAYKNLSIVAGGKPVLVSETGWPSCGNAVGSAVPSLESAGTYFLNFVSWARANHVRYFYFSGLDEAWKAAYEGPQGACWGIRTKDGVLKATMSDVFEGRTIPDNWSGSEIPGGPGQPLIEVTSFPPYGGSGFLKGRIQHVAPAEYSVAVYINVSGGWWTKPFFDAPVTSVNIDGTWSCNVTTGGNDVNATRFIAYLIPRGFAPPLVSGAPSLPIALDDNAIAKVEVLRRSP